MTSNIIQLRRSTSPGAGPGPHGADDGTVIVDVPTVVSEEWLRRLAELLASAPGASRPTAPDLVRTERAGALSLGPLHMDLDQMRVTIAHDVVRFTRQEYLLLKVFMENPGRVFSRRQLLRLAWNHDDWGPGRTVDVHVRRVRAKLGDEAVRLVTVRGFGYRFDALDDQPALIAAVG